MEKLKELYAVPEVAEILGVSEKSVRDFINAGELKAIKIGQWRIPGESIEAFMDARSNQFIAKARSEINSFLDSGQRFHEGEERALIIKDYHAHNPRLHGPLMSRLMEAVPQGSNVQWRYFFDQDLGRARHIFTGNYQVIIRLIAQLEQCLREE